MPGLPTASDTPGATLVTSVIDGLHELHRRADAVADMHDDLGPELAAVAVAAAALGSPSVRGLLRRAAVSVISAGLSVSESLGGAKTAPGLDG